MQKKRYIFVDAKKQKNFRLYAQNIFRHVKIAHMNSVFNQITLIWNNLYWKFRRDIFESTIDTAIWKFFSHLNSKVNIWYEMTTKVFVSFKVIQRFNKQEFRQNDRAAENNDRYNQSIYQSNRFGNYFFFRNQAYQNNRQNRQFARVLSFEKQSLLLIDENAFDSSKTQKFSANADRSDNVYRDRDNSRFKDRVYVINEKDEKKYEIEAVISEINDDVYYNDDLNYYDSDNSEDDENDEKSEVHFVASSTFVFVCRRCNERFSFNNQLHDHLRIDCSRLRKSFTNQFTNQSLSEASVYSIEIEVFFIDAIKAFSVSVSDSDSSSVFRFNADAFKNVEIGYDFRDWSYVKAKIVLIENDEEKNIVIDIDVDITLENEDFIRRQKSDVVIRKMISFIIVRDFDTIQHESSRYVILLIYFTDTKNDIFVKAFIEKEIHLIKNLKVNMLVDNDIIASKDIFVNTINRIANIRSCEIDVFLKIRFRAAHAQQRFIHVKKVIVLSPRAQLVVAVHDLFGNLSFDRDFFFESDDTKFTFYVHLVDFFTKIILITNNTNQSIKISRNFRLRKFVKLDYFHVFQIQEENVVKLITRTSAREHRSFWFKKMISVFVVVAAVVADVISDVTSSDFIALIVSSAFDFQINVFSILILSSSAISVSDVFDVKSFAVSDLIMSNDVIIHQSADTNILVVIVDEFFALWTNVDFAQLSEKNWMRIFLKSDWKDRVSEKTKVYSLEVRDRELVNKIFDELHEQRRMSWTDVFTFFSYSVFCVWKKNVVDESKSRVIVNIRDLNAIIVSDAYFLFLQSDIIVVVRDCFYIFLIDASAFFYQWRVHSDDRHKFIVVTHREQKFFNVAVMKYKNSSAYV